MTKRTKVRAWDHFWEAMMDCGLFFGQSVRESPERVIFLDAVRTFQETNPSVDQIYAFTEACLAMYKHGQK